MDLGLNGRVVVVTGGTGALGRAVVARLLSEGARPVVTWRSERELRDFPSADRVRLEELDLADESAVNGSPDQPAWRLSRVNPAMRAIRSSSLGQM